MRRRWGEEGNASRTQRWEHTILTPQVGGANTSGARHHVGTRSPRRPGQPILLGTEHKPPKHESCDDQGSTGTQ